MASLIADDLAKALRDVPGAHFSEGARDGSRIVLSGTVWTDIGIAGEDVGALCTVVVRDSWASAQPRVTCHDGWMIRGSREWHCYPDGGLCWELGAKWKDQMTILASRVDALQASCHAAHYLVSSVRWLIGRHRLAHLLGLTRWPAEWPYWEHEAAGVEQYRRENHK